jgi:hypothetical protein
MVNKQKEKNLLTMLVVIAVVGGLAVTALVTELGLNQVVKADSGGSGSDNNPCSGNPHDRDSGSSGNPHDNVENGNPHDSIKSHLGEGDQCPGSK